MTSDPIKIERLGQIALIVIDNPPVNAASAAVRAGLVAATRTLDADPEVRAIALCGAGKVFVAGADIREFGKPPAEPWLPEVCQTIEACGTPVVAILHGAALGGGLEVALAAHARVAIAGVTLGFPEVTLGILPRCRRDPARAAPDRHSGRARPDRVGPSDRRDRGAGTGPGRPRRCRGCANAGAGRGPGGHRRNPAHAPRRHAVRHARRCRHRRRRGPAAAETGPSLCTASLRAGGGRQHPESWPTGWPGNAPCFTNASTVRNGRV